MLTVTEAARRLKLSTKTVRKYIHSGRLKAIRFGERGHWRVTQELPGGTVREEPVGASKDSKLFP
jgi:excisionase family DNA binding protein